jgi:hypothetical protein
VSCSWLKYRAIEQHNLVIPAWQQKGRKKIWKPEWQFTLEDIKPASKRGVLDFFWYNCEIYENLLFLHNEGLSNMDPIFYFYNLEDIASPHIWDMDHCLGIRLDVR